METDSVIGVVTAEYPQSHAVAARQQRGAEQIDLGEPRRRKPSGSQAAVTASMAEHTLP